MINFFTNFEQPLKKRLNDSIPKIAQMNGTILCRNFDISFYETNKKYFVRFHPVTNTESKDLTNLRKFGCTGTSL